MQRISDSKVTKWTGSNWITRDRIWLKWVRFDRSLAQLMCVRWVISCVFISVFLARYPTGRSGRYIKTPRRRVDATLQRLQHTPRSMPDCPAQIVKHSSVLKKKKRRRRCPRLTGISKQRRLANARERKRVQTLNDEIEVLRHLLPLPEEEKSPTRSEVVWMAASYISQLTQMLNSSDSSPKEFQEAAWPDFESLMCLDVDQLLTFDNSEEGGCYCDRSHRSVGLWSLSLLQCLIKRRTFIRVTCIAFNSRRTWGMADRYLGLEFLITNPPREVITNRCFYDSSQLIEVKGSHVSDDNSPVLGRLAAHRLVKCVIGISVFISGAPNRENRFVWNKITIGRPSEFARCHFPTTRSNGIALTNTALTSRLACLAHLHMYPACYQRKSVTRTWKKKKLSGPGCLGVVVSLPPGCSLFKVLAGCRRKNNVLFARKGRLFGLQNQKQALLAFVRDATYFR